MMTQHGAAGAAGAASVAVRRVQLGAIRCDWVRWVWWVLLVRWVRGCGGYGGRDGPHRRQMLRTQQGDEEVAVAVEKLPEKQDELLLFRMEQVAVSHRHPSRTSAARANGRPTLHRGWRRVHGASCIVTASHRHIATSPRRHIVTSSQERLLAVERDHRRGEVGVL